VKVEIRRMRLRDYLKIGNIRVEPEFTERMAWPLWLYNKANLLLSLISLRLAVKKFVIFLLFVDGKAEGQSLLIINNGRAESGIVLNKKVRGMGYGTKMMEMSLDWADRHGHGTWLMVYDWNKKAIGMYKKLGFKIYQKSYYMKREVGGRQTAQKR